MFGLRKFLSTALAISVVFSVSCNCEASRDAIVGTSPGEFDSVWDIADQLHGEYETNNVHALTDRFLRYNGLTWEQATRLPDHTRINLPMTPAEEREEARQRQARERRAREARERREREERERREREARERRVREARERREREERERREREERERREREERERREREERERREREEREHHEREERERREREERERIRQAAEAARIKAEEEARRKAEEEARKKAEEERQKKLELMLSESEVQEDVSLREDMRADQLQEFQNVTRI